MKRNALLFGSEVKYIQQLLNELDEIPEVQEEGGYISTVDKSASKNIPRPFQPAEYRKEAPKLA